jgi:hypothetical protein
MAAAQVVTTKREGLEEQEAGPISVKEMLVKLAGAFPFDEAIVEGKTPPVLPYRLIATNFDLSSTKR